jgi:hypothetical protein
MLVVPMQFSGSNINSIIPEKDQIPSLIRYLFSDSRPVTQGFAPLGTWDN